MSEDAQNVLKSMIKLEPKERLTVPQILAHSWLKDTNDDSDTESDCSDDADEKAKNTENEMDLEKI